MTMRRVTNFSIAGLCLIIVAAGGCGDGGAEQATPEATAGRTGRVFVDDLDRELRLPGSVDRIVAGTSFALEYLMALDHQPVLRPEAPLAGLEAEAGRVESIPTMALDHTVGPNIEQIAEADPDLVILSPTFARFADMIEGAAETTVVILRIDALEEVPAKARVFGQLIGKPEAGQALAEDLRRRIAEIQPPTDRVGPTVFPLFGTPAAFFAFRPESYLGSMIDHLGGRTITGDLPAAEMAGQLAPFSFEALVAADPQVILMVHHGPAGEMASALKQRASWADLRAVESGRVHRISERLYMTSPGPSAIRALDALRELLYPKVAADDASR